MRVVVGPVSVQSARAWINYATQVVRDLDAIAPGECFSTPEVRSIFDGYLAEWAAETETKGDFLWEADVPSEQLEYHVHAWHQLATVLERRVEMTGVRESPVEGREFSAAVLRGVLVALESEGPASASFAQYLGAFWPGQHLSFR
jgi:hypothetical protein